MRNRFSNYGLGYRVVSIAKDELVKEDLISDALDFLFVGENAITLFPDETELSRENDLIESFSQANNYDVYELWPDGQFYRCYDDSSVDNHFFVTAKCNSNCVMCPSPTMARRNGNTANISDLIEIARHIPTLAPHLTITGGEPFLAGRSIFTLFEFLHNKFVDTEFLILTNGRVFAINEFAARMKEAAPNNSIFAIPIHGSNPNIHDAITQASNSFDQTVTGIKHLLKLGLRVELRVVVTKLNICDFANIVRFIIRELPGIEYVSVIAMEMTGNARLNSDSVWIPYRRSFDLIGGSILELLNNGIDVKLYNFPLCTVEEKFWPLCEKSISPEKVRFAEICDGCVQKKACCGVFAGTFLFEKDELKAIE